MLNYGINPVTGIFSERIVTIQDNEHHQGGLYAPVHFSPYVDGVFVPDGGEGGPIVSSLGHRFSACPDTNGKYHTWIINGAKWMYRLLMQGVMLGGRWYGTKETPGIFMHANLGITFDIDEVRSYLPGILIERFQTFCGAAITDNSGEYVSDMDIWILVDGDVRFERRNVTQNHGFNVDIELTRSERFLSLVVTDNSPFIDGESEHFYDWCIFGLPTPILELSNPEDK